jgi:hypothetical protein
MVRSVSVSGAPSGSAVADSDDPPNEITAQYLNPETSGKIRRFLLLKQKYFGQRKESDG